jgi:hypothetical protein
MPSKKRQFNARLDDETWDILHFLSRRLSQEKELDVSLSDVVRIMAKDYVKRYPREELLAEEPVQQKKSARKPAQPDTPAHPASKPVGKTKKGGAHEH